MYLLPRHNNTSLVNFHLPYTSSTHIPLHFFYPSSQLSFPLCHHIAFLPATSPKYLRLDPRAGNHDLTSDPSLKIHLTCSTSHSPYISMATATSPSPRHAHSTLHPPLAHATRSLTMHASHPTPGPAPARSRASPSTPLSLPP
jgi:hypothetical protein